MTFPIAYPMHNRLFAFGHERNELRLWYPKEGDLEEEFCNVPCR